MLAGWAIDEGAVDGDGTGVDRVAVYLDGAHVGDATLGRERPDVAAGYGARFGPAGYRYLIDLAGATAGQHRLEARAHSAVSGAEVMYQRTIMVGTTTAAAPTATPAPVGYPAGGLDALADGAAVSGTVQVGGWAIDEGAPTGTGVDRVRVLLDGAYVADAAYGDVRADIGAGYGARFAPSGYRYTLGLAGVAPGTHAVEIRTHSVVTGAEAASTRAIMVTAAGEPHGGLEEPAEGARVNGTIAVGGWALDRAAPTGTGVDRVRVLLDGIEVGSATYGVARADLANGYGARFGPAGFRYALDLTGVAPGPHAVEARARSAVTGVEAAYVHPITVVAGGAAPTPTPGPSAPAASARFGVNAHLLYAGSDRATADLDRIRTAGIGLVRLDVSWDRLEPTTSGVWDDGYVAKLDATLARAAERGLRPILVVGGTPAWARGGAGSAWTPPTQPDDYAGALARLAARYAGSPAARLGLVYEIWNEPNQSEFWDAPGGPNPLAYAALLKATYPRVKAADRAATVLGGSIAHNDRDYLADLYVRGGVRGSLDGLALHPYSGSYGPDATAEPYLSFVLAIDQLAAVAASHGDADLPLWVTEMGWRAGAVPDLTRAAHYRRAVELVRARPRVVAFLAYQLSQDQDLADMGLIAPNGAPTASWDAYTGAATAL